MPSAETLCGQNGTVTFVAVSLLLAQPGAHCALQGGGYSAERIWITVQTRLRKRKDFSANISYPPLGEEPSEFWSWEDLSLAALGWAGRPPACL